MTIIRPALHHVTMRTSRLAEMVAWYETVVGAHVIFGNEGAAWMTNDAANHRIAFLSAPGIVDDPHKERHNAIHHLAFEYASFADLMASYERLRGEGITPSFCLDHQMTLSLYYKDPESNFVELQADSFGDWAVSSEFMRVSPDFAANPIGIFFDADKVWEAHRSGAAFETIRRAVKSGEFSPEYVPSIGLPT